MTGPELKAIMKSAGIRIGETALLFRVSPGTVLRWYKGETAPKQQVVYDLACTIAARIQKAVERGDLPIRDAVKKQRLYQIKAAMKH